MNMRTSRILMPMLAVLVGCGMLVGAVSVMRLSNIVEYVNVIEEPEVPVELCIDLEIMSTDATPGGNLPDYADGTLTLGTAYDMLIGFSTSESLSYAEIIVQFSMTEITPEDVSMGWSDGSSTWTNIAWSDSGDVLTGTLGIVGTHPAGGVSSYYANLIYHTAGEYTFKVWVEGTLA